LKRRRRLILLFNSCGIWVAMWPTPSLTILSGTLIGAKEFGYFFPSPGVKTDTLRFEEQMDAALYFGPPSKMTTSMLPAALCADAEYVSMRLARMSLDPGPTGSPSPCERLERNCGPR
jgi:hypothetical protein